MTHIIDKVDFTCGNNTKVITCRSGVYQVCRGRISSLKKDWNINTIGVNITQKGKGGCNILFSLILRLLGRISNGEHEKGPKKIKNGWGKKL